MTDNKRKTLRSFADEDEAPTKTLRPFADEVPTKKTGPDLSTYQALLSVFDELSTQERLDFIELALLFKELPAADRKRLIEEVAKKSHR